MIRTIVILYLCVSCLGATTIVFSHTLQALARKNPLKREVNKNEKKQ
jgi:hypothetical protein